MVLRKECIRNAFYALLTDYLIRNNFKINNVNFKHNLELGEYTIWLWVLCPYGIMITVEGELKIESIG